MHQMSQREPLKEPVRQKGCVKEAEGVKYFSMVARWIEGAVWTSERIMCGISAAEGEKGVSWMRVGGGEVEVAGSGREKWGLR